MFRAPRRNRERLSAGLANVLHRHFPARTDADVETGRVQSHLGAQDARHLDVTDAVIDGVGVIDPVLPPQPPTPPKGPPPRRRPAASDSIGCHRWTPACRTPGRAPR